jgi:hypothetical protein
VLDLQEGRKYSIHIRTSQNKEYQSDFVSVSSTPDIDSITWKLNDENMIDISVNTHDPAKKSHYYKWNLTETYEYTSQYFSSFIKLEGAHWETRPSSEQIYRCYKTQTIGNVNVTSTDRLSEDIISQYKLLSIPPRSIKLQQRYSLLVQQQIISLEEYNYWINVKKTTESLGGLFDPLPSEVIGNIHSLTNTNEKVIGFVSAGSVKEKRLFISRNELPGKYPPFSFPDCPKTTIPLAEIAGITDRDALIEGVYAPGGLTLIGLSTANATCIDCRIFGGGVTEEPEFWK